MTLALLLGSVLVVLLMAEGMARILDRISPMPARTWQEHRLAVPPPYQQAPYDVADLVAEVQQVKWQTGDTFGWLPIDRTGKYINIDNGRRVTSDMPASPQHTVWVFGGSTVMGTEVPDEYTIPSYLQRELNARTGGAYRVVNLGATTITTKHQLWRLSNTEVAPGDIVIFFDGVNDIIQSLYYKTPAGTMVDENRKAIRENGLMARIVFWLSKKYSDRSSFVRRFLNPFSPQRRTVALPNQLVDAARSEYRENILKAGSFAAMKQAKFIHFLQPSLYSVTKTTEYEKRLLGNGWLYPLELKDIYAIGYPAFRDASAEARKNGVTSYDLTNVFDSRNKDIFLDFCHVNHHGNQMLALAIMSFLPID